MEGPLNPLETVYGSDGIGDEDSSRGMTDRVQTVATAIYRELERMIPTYGEDVVKELMPHVVSILESLDAAYKENEEKVSLILSMPSKNFSSFVNSFLKCCT